MGEDLDSTCPVFYLAVIVNQRCDNIFYISLYQHSCFNLVSLLPNYFKSPRALPFLLGPKQQTHTVVLRAILGQLNFDL